MGCPSCHPSGAQKFEVAPRYLENLCTAAPHNTNFSSYFRSFVGRCWNTKPEQVSQIFRFGNLFGVFTSRSAFGFFLRKCINKFCSFAGKMEAERPTETFIRTIVLPIQLSFTALQSTIAKSHVLFRCTVCNSSFPGSQEVCICSQSNPTYKQTMCDKRYRLDY